MEGFALFLRWKNLVILKTRVIFISVGPESLTNSNSLVIHETAFQASRTLGSSINTVAAFVIYCSEFGGLSFLPCWMKDGRGSSLCLFPALYFLGLQIAFSVCHSLPCQLCLSQRLIHFNCTLECTRERRMDGLFCTYYCIRTFAFLDKIVSYLKSVCLSAHWLCLCWSLSMVPLFPASISLQDLDSASDCTCLVLCSICLLHS